MGGNYAVEGIKSNKKWQFSCGKLPTRYESSTSLTFLKSAIGEQGFGINSKPFLVISSLFIKSTRITTYKKYIIPSYRRTIFAEVREPRQQKIKCLL